MSVNIPSPSLIINTIVTNHLDGHVCLCCTCVCVLGGGGTTITNYDITLNKFGDGPLIQCTTTGIFVKDNMSGRLVIWSREECLAKLDHKLRVSVRCMCLISV